MAASDDGRASDDDDDGDDQAAAVTTTDVSQMSEKQRRKWEKGLQKWRLFVDFLLRHVAVVTYRYNCFEREEANAFMAALEQAELLRATTKLKKGEVPRIDSILTMKQSADLLGKNSFLTEANLIRKYIDLVGRMRALSTIAGGFFKALRKAKVNGIDQIKYCVDHWKGFCVRTYDYTQLNAENTDASKLSELERRFLAWPAVLRTSINLAQRFMCRCCDSTGLELLNPTDATAMARHMQPAEFIVAARMEQMLFDRVAQESAAFSLTSQGFGVTSSKSMGSTLMTSALRQQQLNETNKAWQLPPPGDVDPTLLRPIPDNGLLLCMPSEPPKEKKKKRGRKGGKKGKKSAGGKSGARHKSGKKKKK